MGYLFLHKSIYDMKVRIFLFALVAIAGIFLGYPYLAKKKPLPIYQPSELNPQLVDVSLQHKGKGHTISDFSLLSQLGDTITQANLEGKIYVADFFFTTCPTICPRMTEQFFRVQEQFKNDDEIMLLSHSVFPNHDTVEVLNKYAAEKGVDASKWLLLTGDKRQIYELARKSYFAVTTTGDGGPEDFIHTENFVLVDKEKRLRGFYDGTSKEEVNQLMLDIRRLKAEYEEN